MIWALSEMTPTSCRTKLSKDGDHARPATFEAAIALTNGNFASGSAVLKVHDFWQTHLKTLLDSCAHISNHLDYTKAQHAKDDVKIGGDLTSVSVLSEYMK
ncbi:AG1 protein OS=Streptomyces sp. ACT-1 OX=1609288 GN=SACT1_4896 PE=4 SV=1 [Streptomyces griseus subsp. griseus]